MLNLHELRNKIKVCTMCNLCPAKSGNKQVVASDGPKSSLMLVGEAPGEDEDKIGSPFVGRCGKILDKLLLGARIKREQVFISNAVKCRPKCRPKEGRKNRPPTDAEISTCSGWLRYEIAVVKPKVIITLGKIPTRLLLSLPKSFTLQDYVGKPEETFKGENLDIKAYTVIPCWHPSYLMQHGRHKFEEAVECFKTAKRMVLV